MAQQTYRVENGVGMWLRSQMLVDEASKIALLPHGQFVTKTGDTNNPDWWRVAANFNNQNVQGFCKHALLIPDATFHPPEAASGVTEVHLKRIQPVTRNQKGLEAYQLNETPHPFRNAGVTPQQKASELAQIINWLAVSQSIRYQKTSTDTFCNVYAYDFSCLAGAFVPRVWWTPGAIQKLIAGQAVIPKYGVTVDELTANQLAGFTNTLKYSAGGKPQTLLNCNALQTMAQFALSTLAAQLVMATSAPLFQKLTSTRLSGTTRIKASSGHSPVRPEATTLSTNHFCGGPMVLIGTSVFGFTRDKAPHSRRLGRRPTHDNEFHLMSKPKWSCRQPLKPSNRRIASDFGRPPAASNPAAIGRRPYSEMMSQQ